MAIGPYITEPIKQAGNWTIMELGPANALNYQRTRAQLRKTLEQETDKGQREVLSSMIADCDYAIEWLTTGRRPESTRGIERPYSTTQSNVTEVRSWDPKWIEVYRSPNNWVGYESRELSGDESFRLQDAMRDLSDRERQCFILCHGFGMSEREIAQELHLGRSTVQKFLERASEKIENAKMNSLFLLE